MSLLDRYRSGSELNSVGHFTLDEKRAKNKMARFQLVRQEDFLLLVVQAAVAGGCASIHIETTSERVELRAPGVQLEAKKVKRLEDFLFDTRPEVVSYYLLGVARNAVTPFCVEEPVIAVESDELILSLALKKPFPNLFSHLCNHLSYCPCEVVVNTKQISRISLKEGRMVALDEGEFSVLTLVKHGVMVANKHLDFKVNFQAAAAHSDFKVDASFFDVVEDELYYDVLTEVRQVAHEQLAESARCYAPGQAGREKLLRMLCQNLPAPAGDALRQCPLFTLADRSETVSLNDLSVRAGTTELLHSYHRLNLQLEKPVVLLDESDILPILRELFPGRMKDATAEYRRELERRRHIQQWENSPRDTTLGPATYLATQKVNGPDWQAEIGFLGPPGGESHIDMLYHGKLLCSERLDDVPPGATAVINFDEVEINESWTRPQGRRFRSILTTLKAWLERLFEGIELTERQLYPALLDHLHAQFRKTHTKLPLIASTAPLFPTLDGQLLNFNQVKALPTVALGHRVRYSERLPGHLLPETVITYSDLNHELLVGRLGRAQVNDLREYQERLKRFDRQLASPAQPKLYVSVDRKVELEQEDLKGEIGLSYGKSGPEVTVVFLHRGVEIEESVIKMTKVFRGEIVVQSTKLRPNDDWTGLERDGEFKNLVAALRLRIRELEESCLSCPKLPPNRFLPLLKVYSGSIEDHREKEVFQSTTPGRYHSLVQLEKELEKHGNILRAPMGVSLTDRLVLLEASPNRGIRESVLLNSFGMFKWDDARKVAEKRQRVAGFQARPTKEKITLDQRAEFRFSLTSCKGEVIVGTIGSGRFLDCYYTGRFVCRKFPFLPEGCAGVLDSQELTLSEDFNDAEIPESLFGEITELCEKGLLQCAISNDLNLRQLAVVYALSSVASEAFHSEFDDLPFLLLQGGGRMSIKELRQKETAPGYVEHGFSKRIEPDRLILRVGKKELALIQKKTKLTPYKTEARLLNVEEDRKYLAGLGTDIPARYTFRRSYTSEKGFQAEIAFVPYESQTSSPGSEGVRVLGLDEEGKPLGFLSVRCLPVRAVVQPAEKGRRDESKRPTSQLNKTEMRWFKDRVNDLYLDWVDELSHKEISETERQEALRILTSTKHELGSQEEHPQAFLAQKLWRLPLFACVDGTWISGETLADRFGTEDGPLIICEMKWRAPGHYPLVVNQSLEHKLLQSVFGDKSLQWYEAPPLVDTEQIRSNIQQLVSWGISPFKIVQQKLEALAESIESRVPDTPDPPKKKPKKKKKEKKKPPAPPPSPEAIFLQKMKSEAKALLGNKTYYASDQYFKKTEIGSWILGPPVYMNEKGCFLNSSHASVRWLINFDPDSNSKQYRVGRVLLLILWVGLVNVGSEELTDSQEHEFLQDLLEKMIQTFGS